jgi:ferredoxin
MVADSRKVLVLGCNTCVAVCHAGGEKEAETLASMLKIRANLTGREMEVGHLAVMRQCEPEYVKPLLDQLAAAGLVLSMACGVGVNFLAQFLTNTPVYPAVNTSFYGAVPQPGVFVELCAGCGNCILDVTGGICPIARCAKNLMNGPCGGTNKGKCEISDEIDCAWYLIVERAHRLGTLARLEEIAPPRDWSCGRDGGPRRITIEHLREIEREKEEKSDHQGGRG